MPSMAILLLAAGSLEAHLHPKFLAPKLRSSFPRLPVFLPAGKKGFQASTTWSDGDSVDPYLESTRTS